MLEAVLYRLELLRSGRRMSVAAAIALIVAVAAGIALTRPAPQLLVDGAPSQTQVIARVSTQQPTQHFARVTDGRVDRVELVDSEFLSENPDRFPGTWIETFPDGSARGTFATVGSTYDADADRFLPPQPFASWWLDEQARWQPPTPKPSDGSRYLWDEASLIWKRQEAR